MNFARTASILAGLAILALSSAVLAQEEKVNIIFVNGIQTTVEDMMKSVDRIKERLDESPNHRGTNKKSFSVTGIWNPIGWSGNTEGRDRKQDLMELFLLKTAEELLAEDFKKILAPFNEPTAISIDAAQSIRAYVEVHNLMPSKIKPMSTSLEVEGSISEENMAATKEAISQLTRRIKVRGASIVVPHSQGNLLAHLSYAVLASEFGNNIVKMVRVVNVANTSEFSINNLNFTHKGDDALFSDASDCTIANLEKLPSTKGWTRTSKCPNNNLCDFTIAEAPLDKNSAHISACVAPVQSIPQEHSFTNTYLSAATVRVTDARGVAFTPGEEQFVDRFEDFVYAAAESLATANLPQPTVSLIASPSSIASGQSSTLTWSSSSATSCSAPGGWTNSTAASDMQVVSPKQTTTYTLTCTGAGGSTSSSATVTVTQAGAPTVSLSASPSSITTGQTSTLTWSSTNATSCSAVGGWSNSTATSDTQAVSPTQTTTYTLTCTGSGGPTRKSATVTVAQAGALTVSISANPQSITAGQSSTLTWSSSNATSCAASGGWSGGKLTSGNEAVSPAQNTTYTLTCTGNSGSTSNSATVTVTQAAMPTVSISANPLSITSGQSSTLTWSSTNATSCTASGGWSGSKPTSGNQIVSPTQTAIYTLSCSGDGGSISNSATVAVSEQTIIQVSSGYLATNYEAAMSSDARYVAFSIARQVECELQSDNSVFDVVIYDRQMGTYENLTENMHECSSTRRMFYVPSISSDGRFVAFNEERITPPSNCCSQFQNPTSIFLHDRETGITRLLSKDANGDAVRGIQPVVAGTNYVAFYSDSNALPNGTDVTNWGVYIYDLGQESGRYAINSLEAPGGALSGALSLSEDGLLLAFNSTRALTPADENGHADAHVLNLQTGDISNLSMSFETSKTYGRGVISLRAISASGRYVSFMATTFYGCCGDLPNTYRYDMLTGETVSFVPPQTNGDPFALDLRLSADGTTGIFSLATEFSGGPTNFQLAISRYGEGQAQVVNEADCVPLAISDNADWVLTGCAGALTGDDTNGQQDIYLVRNPLSR